MSTNPPKPDHDSTLVWSTDPKKRVEALLAKTGGDVDEALRRLFGKNTSYQQARVLAECFSEGLGLRIGQFMLKYYSWRRGEL